MGLADNIKKRNLDLARAKKEAGIPLSNKETKILRQEELKIQKQKK